MKLSSLREIVAELDARREIALKYEIERFVRPAEIDFGHFRYTAAPNAPNNLSQRIKDWLEETTGVEWEVLQANDGGPESVKERRDAQGRGEAARGGGASGDRRGAARVPGRQGAARG